MWDTLYFSYLIKNIDIFQGPQHPNMNFSIKISLAYTRLKDKQLKILELSSTVYKLVENYLYSKNSQTIFKCEINKNIVIIKY